MDSKKHQRCEKIALEIICSTNRVETILISKVVWEIIAILIHI